MTHLKLQKNHKKVVLTTSVCFLDAFGPTSNGMIRESSSIDDDSCDCLITNKQRYTCDQKTTVPGCLLPGEVATMQIRENLFSDKNARYCQRCRRSRINPLIATLKPQINGQWSCNQYSDRYTGRWWVGCYIWYSEEGTGHQRPVYQLRIIRRGTINAFGVQRVKLRRKTYTATWTALPLHTKQQSITMSRCRHALKRSPAVY